MAHKLSRAMFIKRISTDSGLLRIATHAECKHKKQACSFWRCSESQYSSHTCIEYHRNVVVNVAWNSPRALLCYVYRADVDVFYTRARRKRPFTNCHICRLQAKKSKQKVASNQEKRAKVSKRMQKQANVSKSKQKQHKRPKTLTKNYSNENDNE